MAEAGWAEASVRWSRLGGLPEGAGDPAEIPPATDLWYVRLGRSESRVVVARGGRTAVILMPPLQADDERAEAVARRVAREGFTAVLPAPSSLAVWSGTSWSGWLDVLEQRAAAGRAAVALAREEFDASCVAIVGVSLGALSAVSVAAAKPPADALVVMLGGGGLATIARHSSLPALRRLRTRAPIPAAWEEAERLGALEPLIAARRIPPGRSLLIDARFDRVIPRKSSTQLWQALGRPPRRTYPSGHATFSWWFDRALEAGLRHIRRLCARAVPGRAPEPIRSDDVRANADPVRGLADSGGAGGRGPAR